MYHHSRNPVTPRTTLFLAIKTNGNHSQAFRQARESVPANDAWKVTPQENDHITIAFLGAVENKDLNRLKHIVREFCRAAAPVKLRFSGLYILEAVPRPLDASLEGMKGSLVALPDPASATQLQGLRRELSLGALKRANFEYGYGFGYGGFTPHNTLARIRRLAEQQDNIHAFMRAHGKMTTQEFTYAHLSLFERNEGVRDERFKYKYLDSFPLGEALARPHNGHAIIPVEAETLPLSRQ